jgi:hypothetical protein
LLQVDAVARRLRKLMALLLEFVHVQHQRQRAIELAGDRRGGILGCPGRTPTAAR